MMSSVGFTGAKVIQYNEILTLDYLLKLEGD